MEGGAVSIICALFGHAPVKDHQWGRVPVTGSYPVRIDGPVIDGVRREHFSVWVDCPRCGQTYMACRIHGHAIADRMESRVEQSA